MRLKLLMLMMEREKGIWGDYSTWLYIKMLESRLRDIKPCYHRDQSRADDFRHKSETVSGDVS